MNKCTEEIKIHVPASLKNELFRLAERDDRALSDYIRHLLDAHVYGHRSLFLAEKVGANRGESARMAPIASLARPK